MVDAQARSQGGGGGFEGCEEKTELYKCTKMLPAFI